MSEMNSLTLNGKTYDCFVDGVARASVVVCSASGESITVSDSSDQPLVGLNIYGKSTQAGTPTPDAPVDIKSIGDDGDVGINVGTDRFVLMTGDGMRGVPVADKSIATYTDGNGQMWYADEIDLERGVYIQRTTVVQILSTWDWQKNSGGTEIYAPPKNIANIAIKLNSPIICSHLVGGVWGSNKSGRICLGNESAAFVGISTATFSTIEALVSWLDGETDGVFCVVPLKTPIETPLTAEQITAYKALHTNKPNTTITNGENAYMSMTYIADAKAYIDNKASGIIPATVE